MCLCATPYLSLNSGDYARSTFDVDILHREHLSSNLKALLFLFEGINDAIFIWSDLTSSTISVRAACLIADQSVGVNGHSRSWWLSLDSCPGIDGTPRVQTKRCQGLRLGRCLCDDSLERRIAGNLQRAVLQRSKPLGRPRQPSSLSLPVIMLHSGLQTATIQTYRALSLHARKSGVHLRGSELLNGFLMTIAYCLQSLCGVTT